MEISIALDAKALTAAIGRMRGPAPIQSMKRALEVQANEARKATVRAFVSRGIGKGIYGRNNSGAWKLITLKQTRVSADNVAVTMHLGGFAAMQEAGGRIAPHEIKPKRKAVLAFAVPGGFGFGGEMVFTKIVHHPGGIVHKHESLKPAVQDVLVKAIEEIRKDLVKLWERAA